MAFAEAEPTLPAARALIEAHHFKALVAQVTPEAIQVAAAAEEEGSGLELSWVQVVHFLGQGAYCCWPKGFFAQGFRT